MSAVAPTGHDVGDDVLAAAVAACEDEPIRTPGAIQPHGVLVVADAASGRLVAASANAADVLGPGALPGAALTDVLPAAADLLAAVLQGTEVQVSSTAPLTAPDGEAHHALAHRTGGLVVLELEPADGDEAAGRSEPVWHTQLTGALRHLQDARSVGALSAELARAVRRLTGFDRVMVYRFDEDWNGEVIAEERREDLEPFLGLHYPASDIPAQARALYERQWLRIIVTSDYTPVPLVPATATAAGVEGGQGAPWDLSLAVLRSVSPVHLAYLRGMGVAASMSISLLHQGRLWGLIACHHVAGPHRPSVPVRTAAEFLGRTASLLLPTVLGLDSYADALAGERVRGQLTELLAARPDLPVDVLTRATPTMADLLPCGGAAVRLHGQLRTVGVTPPAADVAALLAAVGPVGEVPLVTSCLAETEPALARLSDVASGVLAVAVEGGTDGDALVWFRPEVLREVTWGGDPRSSKVLVGGDGGLRLSPRRSFEAWSQTVRATSTRWADHEVSTASALASHLTSTMLHEVERTNRLATALQQTLLLEKLPEVPGLALAARYAPHSDDVVGGDWYDVIPLPSGATAVVLGDVAGHGLAVSAISSQMRNALRAHLLSTEDPALALERLNTLVVELLPGEMATAVVVVLDAREARGGATALVASAGHPPVVHLGARAVGLDDAAQGPALGLVAGMAYTDRRVALEPGDALLLYSDGLVEARGVAIDERVEVLLRAAEGSHEDLEELCDRLLATLPDRSDDTTLVAVRLVGG